jgi:hypothetical protein
MRQTATKQNKTHIWERERIDPIMAAYTAAYKLKAWGKCDELYPTIRAEHEKLLRSWLSIKKIPTDHETLNDALSHLHEVMIKYWKPNTGTSSMSYFITAINTWCAMHFTGGTPSSVKTHMPPNKWAIEREVPVESKRKDKRRIRQELEAEGKDPDDYVIKKKGDTWLVHHKTVGQLRHIEAGDDIQEVQYGNSFDDVCLETLKEYVPDVVTSRAYQDGARVLIDMVQVIRDEKVSLHGRGVQLWLQSALNERLDWSVTPPDMKMCLWTVRQAFAYYREDFPPEPTPLYGNDGYITCTTE